MITINTVEITNEQLESLIRLLHRGWELDYNSITKLPADDCITIVVRGKETGMTMVMGIEADGYTHS